MPQPSGRKGCMAKTGKDVSTRAREPALAFGEEAIRVSRVVSFAFQCNGCPTQRAEVSFNGNGQWALCLRCVRPRRASRIPHRDHCDRTTGLGMDLKGHIGKSCVSERLETHFAK